MAARRGYGLAVSLYDSEARNLRIALCGDLMLTRRLAVYRESRFLALRELLSGADCTFANFVRLPYFSRDQLPEPCLFRIGSLTTTSTGLRLIAAQTR